MDSTAKQPLGTHKSSTNCCDGWRMDSTAKQPLGTHKSSTKCCHGWWMDSTAQTAPRESKIINCNNPDFLHFVLRYFGNFQVIFFNIQVPPKFPPKFRQSLPYIGRSQVIDIYAVYTSNISHLLITQLQPNRPGSQSNLLSSTQHILFNNII